MTTLTISLPDDVQAFINEAVASGKFGSPADAVSAMVREVRRHQEVARINVLLREGLECTEEIEVTPEYWAEKHRRLDEFIKNEGLE